MVADCGLEPVRRVGHGRNSLRDTVLKGHNTDLNRYLKKIISLKCNELFRNRFPKQTFYRHEQCENLYLQQDQQMFFRKINFCRLGIIGSHTSNEPKNLTITRSRPRPATLTDWITALDVSRNLWMRVPAPPRREDIRPTPPADGWTLAGNCPKRKFDFSFCSNFAWNFCSVSRTEEECLKKFQSLETNLNEWKTTFWKLLYIFKNVHKSQKDNEESDPKE